MEGLMENGIKFQSQVKSIQERASAGECIIKALKDQVNTALESYQPSLPESHSLYQLRVSFCGLKFLFRIELLIASDEASVHIYKLSTDELEDVTIIASNGTMTVKPKEIHLTECKFKPTFNGHVINQKLEQPLSQECKVEDFATFVLDAVANALAGDKQTALKLQ